MNEMHAENVALVVSLSETNRCERFESVTVTKHIMSIYISSKKETKLFH